jgi:hypothetical protein
MSLYQRSEATFLNVLYWLLPFFIGIAGVLLGDEFIRASIQYCYLVFSNKQIILNGKDFHLFYPVYYYIIAGIVLAIVTWFLRMSGVRLGLKLALLFVVTSVVSVVVISYIDSQVKLAECSACNDGLRVLSYNSINYASIVSTSLVIALVSVGWAFLIGTRKPLPKIPFKKIMSGH